MRRVRFRHVSGPSGEITAIATSVLAVFAIVTAIYAVRAFRKQSKEVSDKARMLEVQSEQLDEQRKLTNLQTPVLELQAAELRESLDERKREAEQRESDAEQRRRAQASQVFMWEEHHAHDPRIGSTLRELRGAYPTAYAYAKNPSDQPVYEAGPLDVPAAIRRHCQRPAASSLASAGGSAPDPGPRRYRPRARLE